MSLPSRYADIIRAHQTEPPVRIGALATAFGVKALISALPQRVSGVLERKNSEWIIRVNRGEAKVRQRFTIAHELAHFLLHRDSIGMSLTDDVYYRSELSDKKEWEANQLAAEILMPWSLIRAQANMGVKSPSELAEKFEVSETAMRIRLNLPT